MSTDVTLEAAQSPRTIRGTKPKRTSTESPAARERRLAAARAYSLANREKIAAYKAAWKAENAERLAEYHRSYYEENGDKARARSCAWRVGNLERKRAANRAWAAANPDKQRASERKSKHKRRRDPHVRVFKSVSEQIRVSLKGKKDGASWEALLGYTRRQLASHIERQFLPGMSWENYGKWHVDHILASSSFSFTSVDDPEFKACWSLSNLRPLWALDNVAKRDKRMFLV